MILLFVFSLVSFISSVKLLDIVWCVDMCDYNEIFGVGFFFFGDNDFVFEYLSGWSCCSYDSYLVDSVFIFIMVDRGFVYDYLE